MSCDITTWQATISRRAIVVSTFILIRQTIYLSKLIQPNYDVHSIELEKAHVLSAREASLITRGRLSEI